MYCRSLLEEEISYNIYQKTEKKQILPFFIHKTFGKYFSKTIHKQIINHEKLVPLKLLNMSIINIIRYETEYKRASTRATDDISS